MHLYSRRVDQPREDEKEEEKIQKRRTAGVGQYQSVHVQRCVCADVGYVGACLFSKNYLPWVSTALSSLHKFVILGVQRHGRDMHA